MKTLLKIAIVWVAILSISVPMALVIGVSIRHGWQSHESQIQSLTARLAKLENA